MRTSAPLLSLKASGSFAKALVASNWKGRPYLSSTHKPGGLPSSAQLAVRSNFLLARDAWMLLSEEEKEEYNVEANKVANGRITGYNLFIRNFSGGGGGDFLLLETSDFLLLESGDKILLE